MAAQSSERIVRKNSSNRQKRLDNSRHLCYNTGGWLRDSNKRTPQTMTHCFPRALLDGCVEVRAVELRLDRLFGYHGPAVSPLGDGRGAKASDRSTHRVPQTSPSRAAAQAEASPRAHVASGEGTKCRTDRLHIPCTVRPRELTKGNRRTKYMFSGSGIGNSQFRKIQTDFTAGVAP